jgi:intracellular sulfur oxidation DsrE/DsrF family protein
MKKLIAFVLLAVITSITSQAQQPPKIILHLQSADTLVHRSLVNQVANLKKEFPEAAIDVVCHGPGMEFLLKKKSAYIERIQKQNFTGVTFTACEFTMAQRNIKREDLVPYARTVPYALAEIIKKQQNDWLYIKLGF